MQSEQSEERAESHEHASECGSFSINSFGYFVNVTNACTEVFGVRPQHLRKMRIFKYIKRDSKRKFIRHCLKTLESSSAESCSVSLIDNNGGEHQILMETQVSLDKNGDKIIDCRLLQRLSE